MWTYRLFGADSYHVIQWFIIYSFLGWAVESTYMSFCNRKMTNRGFAFSPFCPIYAVGALTVFGILRPLSGRYILLYFAGALTATALEYVTAVVMQRFLGQVWWDYNDKPLNYKGILCAESTIAWGFYTIGLFAFLQKFVELLADSYSYQTGRVLTVAVIGIYTFDFSLHLFEARTSHMPRRVEAIRERVHYLIRR